MGKYVVRYKGMKIKGTVKPAKVQVDDEEDMTYQSADEEQETTGKPFQPEKQVVANMMQGKKMPGMPDMAPKGKAKKEVGEKGNAKSGNYGHAGIPGHQGGSRPRGSGGTGGGLTPSEITASFTDNETHATTPTRKDATRAIAGTVAGSSLGGGMKFHAEELKNGNIVVKFDPEGKGLDKQRFTPAITPDNAITYQHWKSEFDKAHASTHAATGSMLDVMNTTNAAIADMQSRRDRIAAMSPSKERDAALAKIDKDINIAKDVAQRAWQAHQRTMKPTSPEEAHAAVVSKTPSQIKADEVEQRKWNQKRTADQAAKIRR